MDESPETSCDEEEPQQRTDRLLVYLESQTVQSAGSEEMEGCEPRTVRRRATRPIYWDRFEEEGDKQGGLEETLSRSLDNQLDCVKNAARLFERYGVSSEVAETTAMFAIPLVQPAIKKGLEAYLAAESSEDEEEGATEEEGVNEKAMASAGAKGDEEEREEEEEEAYDPQGTGRSRHARAEFGVRAEQREIEAGTFAQAPALEESGLQELVQGGAIGARVASSSGPPRENAFEKVGKRRKKVSEKEQKAAAGQREEAQTRTEMDEEVVEVAEGVESHAPPRIFRAKYDESDADCVLHSDEFAALDDEAACVKMSEDAVADCRSFEAAVRDIIKKEEDGEEKWVAKLAAFDGTSSVEAPQVS